MLRRIFTTGGFIAMMLGCTAQRSQERAIEPFTKIEIRGAVSVVYTQSDTLGLRLHGPENEMGKVITRVEGNILKISSKGDTEGLVTVHVSGNSLKSLEAQGATVFKTEGMIKASEFEAGVSGAAQGNIDIEAETVSCIQTGASHLTLKGRCKELTANISGASSLKAFELDAVNAKVESSGAASAKVAASGSFVGNATGASSIRLKGEPNDVTAESSSAASITRVKPRPEKSSSDTVTWNLNRRKVIIVNDDQEENKSKNEKHVSSNVGKFKHWRGVALGVNGYIGQDGGLELTAPASYLDLNYARSFNIQINPIERQFNIYRHYCKIVTGIGFDLHRYELARHTTLNADSSFTSGTVDSTGIYKYERNRLRTTSLQVPLLLEFNTSSNYRRTFHFAVGVIGQYLIGASVKQELVGGGFEIERINRDDYNLNPFGAKAHVNFGYRGWTIYGEYNLTPLFKSGKGPELYPFAAGLRIIPFS